MASPRFAYSATRCRPAARRALKTLIGVRLPDISRFSLHCPSSIAACLSTPGVINALSRPNRKLVSGVVATITVLFMTLFLLLELPAMTEGVLRFVPEEKAVRARRVGADVNRSVAGERPGDPPAPRPAGAP